MAKKSLGLSNIASDFAVESNNSIIPQNNGSSLSEVNGVNNQIIKQMEVIEAIGTKTKFANQTLTEIDEHATKEYEKLAKSTSETKKTARNKPHQEYVEQFSDAISEIAAQQMMGMIKIATVAVANQVDSSIYPRSDPVKKRGLFNK